MVTPTFCVLTVTPISVEDRATRINVSCGIFVIGSSTLYSFSRTQKSASACRVQEPNTMQPWTCCGGLFLQKILNFLAVRHFHVNNSSACNGIMNRFGVDRVRHLETGSLWLQLLIAERRGSACNIKGTLSSSDLGTKASWSSTQRTSYVVACGQVPTIRILDVGIDRMAIAFAAIEQVQCQELCLPTWNRDVCTYST